MHDIININIHDCKRQEKTHYREYIKIKLSLKTRQFKLQ